MKRTTWALTATLVATLAPATAAQAAEPVTVRFAEPGERMFTVPSGVTSLRVVAIGGRGGQGGTAFGGFGARVEADLPVAPGQALRVDVGAAGGIGGISYAGAGGISPADVPSPGGSGGTGGGGRGGTGGVVELHRPGVWGGGGGGGGASSVHDCLANDDRTACDVLPGARIVAAGGGGGAADRTGGDGGTPLGAPGESGPKQAGGGGTLLAGGSSASVGGAGSLFQGGSAEDLNLDRRTGDHYWFWRSGGGGGGGGYYGGGAGIHGYQTASAGGGGSSYGPQGATYAVERSAPPSVTLTFVDTVAPSIHIDAPVDGATYIGGEPVMAGFACEDDGSGVASCAGTVANGESLDMSPGEHALTVVATDRSGNWREVTTRYTVLGEPVSPGTPALPPSDEDVEPPLVAPPAGKVARPTLKLRTFNCGRRTCRVGVTLGGDVERLRAELVAGGRRVVKARAAEAGASRISLRRPSGDAATYQLTLTAIGADGATVSLRRTVRP